MEEFEAKYQPEKFIRAYKRDKVAYLLHSINEIPFYNKSMLYHDGFIPLCSEILQKRLGNYKEYLDFLQECGIIESNRSYTEGNARTYRINRNYGVGLTSYEITDWTFGRNIDKACTALRGTSNHPYSHLNKRFLDGKLAIHENAALLFIQRSYDLKKQFPYLVEKKYMPNRYGGYERPKDINSQYNSSIMHVENFKSGRLPLPSMDETGFRLHTILTNMNSTLRNAVTYDGKRLIALDIKNSQPYFSSMLFTIKFWEQTIKDKRYKDIYKIILKSNKLIADIMLSKIAEFLGTSDVQQYVKLVQSGQFYEYFMEGYNKKHGTNKERDQIKVEMLKTLFSHNNFINRKGSEGKDMFKELFPNVYELFRMIKKGEKKHLAILLQRIESDIVLNHICEIAAHTSDMPLFTIHDSIVTTEEYQETLEKIMNHVFLKEVGALPVLKPELWSINNIFAKINELRSKIIKPE